MVVPPKWPSEFSSIAPAGYYVALRIGFAFPLDENNAFSKEWVDYYTKNGLMLFDPVVRWVYGNSGTCRWGDIDIPDPRGVLSQAAKFGMNYGAVICIGDDPSGQRSYGTFARSDRELTDSEIALLQIDLKKLHNNSGAPTNLTNAEIEALKLVKDGLRLKEIAYRLGVSEGAIKQRLKGAKKKLGARTNTQAASMAVEFRLL